MSALGYCDARARTNHSLLTQALRPLGKVKPFVTDPSDIGIANPDQIAEDVRKLLAPRLDALEKKGKECQQLFAEIASVKAEGMRKKAQIELLTTENAAMQRRLEQLENINRSSKVILSNIPKEELGARPIDSVKNLLGKLPAQNLVHQRHSTV